MQILENHKRTRMMMARFNRFRTLTDSRSGIFARSTDSPTVQHFQNAQRIPSLRRKQSHFHIELSNGQMADSIAEATGAKSELLNALHNVSDEDFKKRRDLC